MNITNDRLQHCIAVGRFMKEEARKRGWSEEKCQDMFLLGFVHDIGYEFSDKPEDHLSIGAYLLRRSGYRYWKEVYYHGLITDDYNSDELTLLNTADLNVDAKGIVVGVKARIADIGNRYGNDSMQRRQAEELAQRIGLL